GSGRQCQACCTANHDRVGSDPEPGATPPCGEHDCRRLSDSGLALTCYELPHSARSCGRDSAQVPSENHHESAQGLVYQDVKRPPTVPLCCQRGNSPELVDPGWK